jgi:acetylornithine/succinyldiaminopimelate/putrescine aminotransferase
MAASPDEIQKAFKGLALAAARVRELADSLGREGLLKGMPRRQEDALRQLLLDASRDLERTQQVVRGMGSGK